MCTTNLKAIVLYRNALKGCQNLIISALYRLSVNIMLKWPLVCSQVQHIYISLPQPTMCPAGLAAPQYPCQFSLQTDRSQARHALSRKCLTQIYALIMSCVLRLRLKQAGVAPAKMFLQQPQPEPGHLPLRQAPSSGQQCVARLTKQ